jgi:hypothetical protein
LRLKDFHSAQVTSTLPIQNVTGLELIMISINASLIIILVGAIVLMAGILLFKPRKTFRSTCSECVAWGFGFVLSMSVQVAVIAAMY